MNISFIFLIILLKNKELVYTGILIVHLQYLLLLNKCWLFILYWDENSGKRYPALFCLTNNKKFEGYNLIFKRMKEIITVDHTKDLNILSYSIDFEKGLQMLSN